MVRDPAYSSESIACARVEPEVVVYDGPLPPLGDGPLSKAELSFREALEGAGKRDSKYSRWAACARAAWHARTGTPELEGE